MREEQGLRPDSLDGLVAVCIQNFRGWRLAPRSILGENPRWIFPVSYTHLDVYKRQGLLIPPPLPM